MTNINKINISIVSKIVLFKNWLKIFSSSIDSQLRRKRKREKDKFILHFSSSVGISRIKFHPMKRMRDAQPAELSRPYYFELVPPGTFHGLSESDRAEKTRDPSNSFLRVCLASIDQSHQRDHRYINESSALSSYSSNEGLDLTARPRGVSLHCLRMSASNPIGGEPFPFWSIIRR